MRILYLSIILVILDQVSKILIRGIYLPFFSFDGIRYENIIGNYVRITFIENEGMAFGFIPFGENSTLYLSVFTLIACIGLLIYFYLNRNESLWIRLPLAIILAGAFGNLIDRTFYGLLFNYGGIFQGRVVDFIDVDFFDIHSLGLMRWPVFNFADVYVSVGVLGLFIGNIVLNQQEKRRIMQEKSILEEYAQSSTSNESSEVASDTNEKSEVETENSSLVTENNESLFNNNISDNDIETKSSEQNSLEKSEEQNLITSENRSFEIKNESDNPEKPQV